MAKDDLLHSSQLDERMRRGNAEVRPRDKALKWVVDGLNVVAFGLLIAVLLAHIAVGLTWSIEVRIYVLAFVGLLLAGNSYIFNQIRWRALRGAHGAKILEKWKADLQLTIVSIAALFTVVFVAIVEILALLVFLGILDAGSAGVRFAGNFVLFQVIIMLVYVMAVIVREQNLSSYQPGPGALMAAHVLTGVGATAIVLGALLASGVPQRAGVLADITVSQSVYVVTLGVGLDFIAMRIRMRLPSLWSQFRGAVETARRANPAMKEQLRKKAQTTYIVSFLFVALSMAFSGAIATGNLAFSGTRSTIALVIFYVGTGLILLGLVAVRLVQSGMLKERTIDDGDDLKRLVGQKRRSQEDIFRMSVYAVAGFLALIFIVAAFLVGSGRFMEESTSIEPVLDDDGNPVFERGQPMTEEVTQVSGIHKKYGTDLFLVGFLFAAGPYGYFFNRERKRIEAIDEKFPDFLRDIAESARAGMTLPRALVSASRGSYGALTDDIKQMAAQVEWGVEFSEALERFAMRAKTPLIDRTVALVVEAQRAGGNVVDILTAASDDAREIKQIVSERNEQMSMYSVVVFIAYFVFIAVVLILAAQFIPAFKEAVGAASGQQVGGLTFKDFDPEDFNTLFFHAAIVQAIGGGLVGGVLTRGHPVAGFNSITIMIIAAWVSFRIIVGAI
ncbi:MAG: type II secretion system F family protein [Thermoplasmatota archaeon]